ncbi:hypothetical protein [Lachnoclostridium sp. An76]|uniref:hypothetical protein n=1 Tax=Lachnoclostridium sp. An76 TaxID=1965654 RepID=UPI000B38A18E|nr:hypothetical protein [Lachnoclostridium sp. An76]OUN34337.1 hypothetical protein B5G27_09835 [Lachnoclostridium sp. An76]
MQNQENRKKRQWIILAAVLVILAAAAGLFLTFGTRRENPDGKGIVLEEGAEDWDGEMKDMSEGQTGIKIPGYGEITVPAGETTWKITLANPEENTCYFKYTVTIDDSENPIYESDLIEPGKAVREFDVTEPLEAGDYEIHLNISTYAMDEELTPLNGAVVKAVLHVV